MLKLLTFAASSSLLLQNSSAFISRSAVQRKTNHRISAIADFSAFHDPTVINGAVDAVQHVATTFGASSAHFIQSSLSLADEVAASPYSKVDKTGFIGFFATYIELAIDAAHTLMQNIGFGKNTYSYSIMLFTLLSA
jgi:adenylosuccinate lyase